MEKPDDSCLYDVELSCTNEDASPELVERIAAQIQDDTQCEPALAYRVACRVMDIIAEPEWDVFGGTTQHGARH